MHVRMPSFYSFLSLYIFDMVALVICSFQHLALLWKGIGKYKHMNLRSFGLSIVLTTQRKERLISVGCKKYVSIIQFSVPIILIFIAIEDIFWNFFHRRGHIFDYTCAVSIYEMCVEEPIATVSRRDGYVFSCKLWKFKFHWMVSGADYSQNAFTRSQWLDNRKNLSILLTL